jgi:tripartite ATP-independent transporter DctP family solute receptor
MVGITRRTFVGSVAAASMAGAGLAPFRARAAEFSYKYANNLPLTHPLNLRAQEAAAKIGAESGGRMEIQIFPNNQLGGDTDMLSQVRSGAIEFFTPSALVIATLVPVAPINAVGFAFKDYAQVWAAMDGDLGAHVRSGIAKAGLHALERMWDNGFREITTGNRPIQTPEDLHGLKIRVPVSPLGTSMFKGLAASPTSIQFSEVYTALQTHVVEAQENPLAIIQSARLYEVQKYCSLTNHIWDGFWFIANGKAWEQLPPDLKETASRNLNEAGLRQREDVRKLNDSVQADLQSKGLAFNSPDPEPFRAPLRKAGFYSEWRDRFGAETWGLLEKYVGSLA